MDKIIMKEMKFFAHHGNMVEENTLGQKFVIDVELGFEKTKLGLGDDVKNTVDYSKVYDIISSVIVSSTCKTIEYVANTIANAVLEKHQKIDTIKVVLKKPEAPVPGIFDWMGVEIMRSRDGK